MNSPAVLNQPIVISQYEKLTTDISIAEQKSDGVSFNYRDQKENRLARSHVHGLRTLKGSIESARKEAKSYALDYGRRVDTAAKELSDRVEALILPHETEIKKIEQEEADRKAKHQAVIAAILDLMNVTELAPSASINERLKSIKGIDTSVLEEFTSVADAHILEGIKSLEAALAGSLKREQEAAELARLRKESAEREEKERVERIQREAVEAEQRRASEAKSAADRAAKEEQARKDRAAKEKVERAKLAEEQAKVAAAQAEIRAKEAEARAADMAKREKERVEQVEREIAEADARRQERDRKERENRVAMVRKIACAIDSLGTNPMLIAEAIVAGAVANVRVDWEA